MHIRHDRWIWKYFPINNGVPQGSILGPVIVPTDLQCCFFLVVLFFSLHLMWYICICVWFDRFPWSSEIFWGACPLTHSHWIFGRPTSSTNFSPAVRVPAHQFCYLYIFLALNVSDPSCVSAVSSLLGSFLKSFTHKPTSDLSPCSLDQFRTPMSQACQTDWSILT